MALAGQAQAQTTEEAAAAPAAESVDVVPDIVVTAQFRSQRLQDTPLAITASTAAMLEARSQTSIAQIAVQSPNVTLQPSPATFGPSMQAFIRGVGQSESTFSVEPGVGIYVDDVYYSTVLGSVLDLLDLERVEILRGPQGTLAGQNSIGGAIKLYSRRPKGRDGGYLQATYGAYDRVELRGAAEFTLVPDELFARISGTSVNRDGYVTRYDYACTHPGSGLPSNQTGTGCKLGTEGGQSYIAGRLAVRWAPTDQLEVNIAGDVTRDRSEPAPNTLLWVGNFAGPGVPAGGNPRIFTINGVPIATPTGSQFVSYSPFGFAQDPFSNSPYVNYENYLNSDPRDGSAPYAAPIRSSIDSWGVSGNIAYEINDDLSLTSITAYRKYTGLYASADGTPFNLALVIQRPEHRQFSQELRLNGKIGSLVDYTVGGFYLKSRSTNASRLSIVPIEAIQVDEVPSARTIAAFANVDVHLTEQLDLSGGLRYTDVDRSFRYFRSSTPDSIFGGAPPPLLVPLNGREVSLANKRLDYRAALQYRWSEAVMTYASISTGFKSGGFNQRPVLAFQAIPHDEEKLTAYEIGLKSDLFDRRARINLSAFRNKYDNIVLTLNNCPIFPGQVGPGGAPFTGAPCSLPFNVGEATVQGLEAEVSLQPIPGMLIDASFAYLDFDYDSLSPLAAPAGITTSMTGPFVQKTQFSIGGQYQFDVAGGSLTPRLDFNRRGSFFTNAANSRFSKVAARSLLNGRITYRYGEDWQLALEVTNLTKQVYYDSLFDNRGSGNFVSGRPGRPREWALTLRRNF